MALLGAKHCLSLEMREDQTAKKKKKILALVELTFFVKSILANKPLG